MVTCTIASYGQVRDPLRLVIYVCLQDVSDKLYQFQDEHLYSRLILVGHKEVLLTNCSDSSRDSFREYKIHTYHSYVGSLN